MRQFVRTSKFRHVYGKPKHRNETYECVKVSNSAWDTNYIDINTKHFVVNWNAGGGGAFAVVPLGLVGRLPGSFPLFTGHTDTVLDTKFSPFDEDLVASASEDQRVLLWRVPQNLVELETNIETPLAELRGHGRKVGHLSFNPVAANVLASAGGDYTVRVWDVENSKERVQCKGFKDNIQGIAWSWGGDKIGATCRDKKLRIFDARSGDLTLETQAHMGIKGSRITFLGDSDYLATTGFARTSQRELCLWDQRNISEPTKRIVIDMSAGVLMPFYDEGTGVLFIGGKGDGNVRYYEFADGDFHYLSEYSSSEPQRGLGMMPKRALDIRGCEIMRMLKISGNTIEQIGFHVPRESHSFQQDIFPPAPSGIPALSAADYFSGTKSAPNVASLENAFHNPIVHEHILVPDHPTTPQLGDDAAKHAPAVVASKAQNAAAAQKAPEPVYAAPVVKQARPVAPSTPAVVAVSTPVVATKPVAAAVTPVVAPAVTPVTPKPVQQAAQPVDHDTNKLIAALSSRVDSLERLVNTLSAKSSSWDALCDRFIPESKQTAADQPTATSTDEQAKNLGDAILEQARESLRPTATAAAPVPTPEAPSETTADVPTPMDEDKQ